MTHTWPRVPLGEVLKLALDVVPIDPSATYRMAGVYSFGRGLFARGLLGGSETTYKAFHLLHENDLVLSQLKAWEGAIGRVTKEFEGWYLSPQFPTFRAIPGRLEIRFIEWLCKQPSVWEELERGSRGMGARRNSVSPKQFLSLRVPLPPLSEQRRIVARIEELATKINEASRLRRQTIEEANAVVEATARRMLAGVDAATTELRFWLHRNGEGIQTGPFGAQLGRADFVEAGVPVLTIGNVQYGGLKLDELKYVSEEKARGLDRYRIKSGDILFARMGTVGRCCIVPEKAEGWLINYHIIRVALDKSRVEPRYIHWTIRASADVEEYLGEKIRGATRQGVNSAIVGSLPCRVPTLNEQRRVVAYLDDLQEKVDALKQVQAETGAELDAMLPSVLDKAFKGELRFHSFFIRPTFDAP